MAVTIDQLKYLGFSESSKTGEWHSDTEYLIRVFYNDVDQAFSSIDYGKEIKIHHKGISNFKKPENLVVLECVISLLRKGYPPKSIELEKTWKSGHGTSGRLDILLNKKTKAFGMIECKTWGEEYLKERDNILEDGGQLFSYLIQEKTTETLILYTSKISDDAIIRKTETIDAKQLIGSNTEALHQSWDRSFIPDGIFHETAAPYFSKKHNLKKSDLQELDRESGRGLFNSFAEILRRHVISDKSNAFNKIFNLFVCKIYDEDTKNINDELDFQWKSSDTFDSLIQRLGDLYIHGLKDYLQIDITKEYFSAHTELAFIDIFNRESFYKNSTVIKEVVELLQGYQIKYTSKHQFLGDFFEKLLNTGIKQEAGQFFTPIPLARFFIKSIPLDQIIENNIASKNPNVLPFIMDYACGCGHFLTETIDELEGIIQKIDVKRLVGRIQKKFIADMNNYYWARDYIYGIEKDYRLAKTTKIAMFLNGDGDAIIINGDGLDDFKSSKTYAGLLKMKEKSRYNPSFDVIVSNPPFSISGFRQYLVNGKNNYSLYSFLSSKSSEIECMFLERALQMLKEEGMCGIILPLSILNSDISVYATARKMLLVEFEIMGIVELRDKTFIATNTTTVGVFLRKRTQNELRSALVSIHKHYIQGKSVDSIDSAIEKLITACPECKPSKNEVKAFFTSGNITQDTIKQSYIDSSTLPPAIVFTMIAYLNKTTKTVIAYAGEKKEQEDFLGYRFSNSRGKEGIEFIMQDGKLKTALYDSQNLMNPEKVNAHIRANFINREIEIPESLKKRVLYINTISLINSFSLCLNNPSSYLESDNFVVKTNSQFGDIIDTYPQKACSIENLIKKNKLQYISGLTYNKSTDEVPRATSCRVLTASNINLKTGRLIFGDKIIYLREDFVLPTNIKPRKGDIIISNASGSLAHLGKCAYVETDMEDTVIGGFLSIIRPTDDIIGKAIFYRLLSLKYRTYVASLRDQNINNMNLTDICRYQMTLPMDLKGFYDEITKKEIELSDLEKKIGFLNIST